jgi:hypothetical protein
MRKLPNCCVAAMLGQRDTVGAVGADADLAGADDRIEHRGLADLAELDRAAWE